MEDNILRCDRCGAFNWNLASDGKPHHLDTPEARHNAEIKGYELCLGVWRETGRSFAEFDPATRTVQGRYSATVFGKDQPFAYSDFEQVILQSAERKRTKLRRYQYIIVADRRLNRTVVTLEALPNRQNRTTGKP